MPALIAMLAVQSIIWNRRIPRPAPRLASPYVGVAAGARPAIRLCIAGPGVDDREIAEETHDDNVFPQAGHAGRSGHLLQERVAIERRASDAMQACLLTGVLLGATLNFPGTPAASPS